MKCIDLYHVYDSLRTLSNIRVDAELPYYGMKQDDVLSMLPEPSAVSDTMRLTDTMEFDLESHGVYDNYLERLSGTTDEINVMTFFGTFRIKTQQGYSLFLNGYMILSGLPIHVSNGNRMNCNWIKRY